MKYLFSVQWKNITIGTCYISKGKYIFIYDKEGIRTTREFGFDKLIGFPDIDEIYVSDNLFPIFESRIIAAKRSNNLTSEDKINFLIQTEGRVLTDNISIKDEGEHVKKRI